MMGKRSKQKRKRREGEKGKKVQVQEDTAKKRNRPLN
jgi:hypothetical protein